MKCITDGKEVRRVPDKVAEHFISREGWSYCQKKEQKNGYICPKCGKHYLSKPEKCSGSLVTHHMNREGEHVVKRVSCDSKVFDKGIIYIPVWK